MKNDQYVRQHLWVAHLLAARDGLLSVLNLTRRDYPVGGSVCRYARTSFSSRSARALRPFIPYSIQRHQDSFVILNRDYKPIGFTSAYCSKDWTKQLDYGDYPSTHIPVGDVGGDSALRKYGDTLKYWLFDDVTAPWYGKKETIRLIRLIDNLLPEELTKTN